MNADAQRLIGLLPVALGGYLLFRAFTSSLRLSRVLTTKTSPIAAARGALVELQGHVVARELLTAPMSGASCVWYDYSVHEHRGTTRGRSRWVQLCSGKEGREFVLEDDSGRALVRPAGAHVELAVDTHGSSGLFSDPTPQLQRFLAQVGVDSTGLFGMNRRLRVTERFLSDGDALYVLGAARRCGPTEARDSGAILVVDDRGPDFVLSDHGELGLSLRLAAAALGFGLLGALLGGIGLLMLAGRLGRA